MTDSRSTLDDEVDDEVDNADDRGELTEADVGTVLDCGCEVTRANIPCGEYDDGEDEMRGHDYPDTGCDRCRFGVPAVYHDEVVVLLDGRPQPGVHAAWIIDGEEQAEAFRAYVSDEVDPAVKVRAADPVAELLHWREAVALPAQARALREIPLPPVEIAALTAQLCQSQPTEIAADLAVKLVLALDDWLAGGGS